MAKKPIAIDLFCGLGGWAEGLLAEGFYVVGFDIERHDYGTGGYPGQLVIQDVLTLHGSQFRNAAVIVASPPCQAYSYMAMPWSRAKAIAAEYRSGKRSVADLNALFDACFRIQREACEAAGRHIPLIVENVRGAQPWVGRSAWNYGSFHLWGDVPALMPITLRIPKHGPSPGKVWKDRPLCLSAHREGTKLPGNNSERRWEDIPIQRLRDATFGVTADGVKGFTPNGEPLGKNKAARLYGSKSPQRKAASAQIAKIPFPLAQHIARIYK